MADADVRDELARLVRDVAAYASYLRQIGDSYVSAAPTADPVSRDESPPPMEEPMPRSHRPPDAPSLFDEAAAPSDDTLEAIRDDIGECTRCKLHEGRTHIVFGEGNPKAPLMFVGEGPGADEDATGRPFVGAAGKLLDRIIEAIGLKREDVYIANVVKCRPPGNRKPEKDESSTCQQFLFRQIDVIRPKIIVALGNTPVESLLGLKVGITKARGEFYDYHGIKLMPTFHPAYLLRDPTKKREVWEDMKKVRAELER
jgi:uracil-DNA glycosylase